MNIRHSVFVELELIRWVAFVSRYYFCLFALFVDWEEVQVPRRLLDRSIDSIFWNEHFIFLPLIVGCNLVAPAANI